MPRLPLRTSRAAAAPLFPPSRSSRQAPTGRHAKALTARSTKAAVAAADRAAVAVGRAVGKSPRAALAYLTAVHLVLRSRRSRLDRGTVSATAGIAASAATELLPGHVHDLAAACAEFARSRGGA